MLFEANNEPTANHKFIHPNSYKMVTWRLINGTPRHTGEHKGVMGSINGIMKNHRINVNISTEAELIGADNAMPQIILT